MRGALIAVLLALAGPVAWAGGSNYGVAPGAREPAGQITEVVVPEARGARDPAIAPDGSVFFVKQRDDAIGRFDPAAGRFREWKLAPGAAPHGNLVTLDGRVWATGNGDGTLIELDPASGRITAHRVPSGGDPHTVITDGRGSLWFTEQAGNRIVRFEIGAGHFTEYPTRGGPYGLALDARGRVWFCQMGGDRVAVLDPASGVIAELDTGRGSRPRRMAAAPDGAIWVVLYGTNRVARIDPEARRIEREIALPGGEGGGGYAINVDGAGYVWVNEFHRDTVVRLDPASGAVRVFELPTKKAAIRKMTIDAQGRLWYLGTANGRLGVIE